MKSGNNVAACFRPFLALKLVRGPSSNAPTRSNQPEVLIVEDEEPIQKMIAVALREGVLKPAGTNSAEEAIALLKSSSGCA